MGASQQAFIAVEDGDTVNFYGWDESAFQGNLVLSDGDRTASITAYADAYGSVVSKTTRSTGKYYFESITFQDAVNDAGIGFAAETYKDKITDGLHLYSYVGSDADSFVFNPPLGDSYSGANTGSQQTGVGTVTVANGDVMGLFINFDLGMIWNRNSTTIAGDPVAGTSPVLTFTPNTPLYIAGMLWDGSIGNPSYVALNTGDSPFVHALPSGWSSWDGSQTA